jgi:N-methylhydantoinase B
MVVSPRGEIDEAATEAARKALRESRPEILSFDFGPLPPVEELRKQIAQERRDFDAALAQASEVG